MKLKFIVVLLVLGFALPGLAWAQNAKAGTKQAITKAKKAKAKMFARRLGQVLKGVATLGRLKNHLRRLRRRAKRLKRKDRNKLQAKERQLVARHKQVRKQVLKRASALSAVCKRRKNRANACKRVAKALHYARVPKINHPFENVVISHKVMISPK